MRCRTMQQPISYDGLPWSQQTLHRSEALYSTIMECKSACSPLPTNCCFSVSFHCSFLSCLCFLCHVMPSYVLPPHPLPVGFPLSLVPLFFLSAYLSRQHFLHCTVHALDMHTGLKWVFCATSLPSKFWLPSSEPISCSVLTFCLFTQVVCTG